MNRRNQTSKEETSIRGKELFQEGHGRKEKEKQRDFARPGSSVNHFNSKKGKTPFAPSSLSRNVSNEINMFFIISKFIQILLYTVNLS